MHALFRGRSIQVIKLLVESHRIDLQAVCAQGKSVLHCAIVSDQLPLVEYILSFPVDFANMCRELPLPV